MMGFAPAWMMVYFTSLGGEFRAKVSVNKKM
jgi:hypothetical protein